MRVRQRPFKRARFGGFAKRRFRRRRNVYSYIGETNKPYSYGFKGRRKLGGRKYRSTLYRITQFKSHWRSSFSNVSAATTGSAGVVQSNHYFLRAINVNFWNAAGGAREKDPGVAVPPFNGDIVIRGGYVRLQVSPVLDTDPVRVRVWCLWSKAPYLAPTLASFAGVNDTEFDPTMVPDFNKYARVLYTREVVMRTGDNSFQLVHKLRPQKIDQNTWLADEQPTIYWWISLCKAANTAATIQTLDIMRSFNLSFSADAV